MRQLCGAQGLTIAAVLLALLCEIGCAPPGGLQAGGDAQADPHQVPFHDEDPKPSRLGNSPAPQETGPNPEPDLPFQDPRNLPAGTLLTVRLKNPIFAGNPRSNGKFEAVVDQPIVIDGNRLVPLGASVAGRVESAQASNLKSNRGYVRLTLESIHLAGSNVRLETASLFVRGNAGQTHVKQTQEPRSDPSATVIQLEKGRRLVFRLTEPIYVAASQRAQSGH